MGEFIIRWMDGWMGELIIRWMDGRVDNEMDG